MNILFLVAKLDGASTRQRVLQYHSYLEAAGLHAKWFRHRPTCLLSRHCGAGCGLFTRFSFSVVSSSPWEVWIMRRRIRRLVSVWGGRFHHLLGKNDKGKAVEILKELFENELFSTVSVGIGDSLNDLPMLMAVDHPIFLKEKESLPVALSLNMKNLTVIEGAGPRIWNEAILGLIRKLTI